MSHSEHHHHHHHDHRPRHASRKVEGFPLDLLGDFVAVRRDKAASYSAGGIILVESSGATKRGVVVAVGPGVFHQSGHFVPTRVSPGDRVLLPDYWGNEVHVDGQLVLVDREGSLPSVEVGGDRSPEDPWVAPAPVLSRADVESMIEDVVAGVVGEMLASS
jgi:chaperonin GroES